MGILLVQSSLWQLFPITKAKLESHDKVINTIGDAKIKAFLRRLLISSTYLYERWLASYLNWIAHKKLEDPEIIEF